MSGRIPGFRSLHRLPRTALWISRGKAQTNNRGHGPLWSAFPGQRTQKLAANGEIANEDIWRNCVQSIPKFIEEFVTASLWIGPETNGLEAPIPFRLPA